MEIIAKFSLLRCLVFAAFFFATVGPLYYYALSYPGGPVEYLEQYSSRYAVLIVGAWLGGVVGIWLFVPLLWQLAFRQQAAVWVDDRYIHWLQVSIRKVHRQEVLSVSRTRRKTLFGTHTVIVLHLKDGTQKFIPTGGLSTSVDSLCLELSKVIDPSLAA